MQTIGRQPQRAPDGTPVHYERHRPEQTTLYRLVQQHAATFFAQAEDAVGAGLPQFGMAQTAAHLVDHVIPHVPVRRWVLSLPIPLRQLLAAQPKLVTPVLQVLRRVITRHLLGQTAFKPKKPDSGAVTLIQRFGSAVNLNVHLHCLVLDGVYRRGIDGAPEFVEVPEPTDEALQAVLRKIITRLMKLLILRGVLVEEEGSTYMADNHGDPDDVRVLKPLQAAACTYRIAFGPRAGQKVLTLQSAMPREKTSSRRCAPTSAVSACTPQCAARPTTGRRWNYCAATSPARHWPTNACRPTPPRKWCSSSRSLARRDHAPCHVAAGVHAAPGSPGAQTSAASDLLARRAGTVIYNFGQASRAGGAASLRPSWNSRSSRRSSRTWDCRRGHRHAHPPAVERCKRSDDSDLSPFRWLAKRGYGDRLCARVFGTDGCGATPRANP